MTSFGEGLLARHAGVLPSFAAHMVRRRIRCSAGEISGDDLLAWCGTLPSERRAAEIRTIFVDGRRNRFAEIWNHPVGVRLSDGWEQAVAPTDRDRIQALVATLQTPAEFATLTLRDVKTALSRSVGDVLGVLARLEALYWTPAANQLRQADQVDEQAQPTREVTDEWRTRVRIAASSGWVANLDILDIRFPRQSSLPVAQWLLDRAGASEISPASMFFCEQLIAADKCDWRTELEAITRVAMRVSERRPGTELAKERWVGIFLSRFSGPTGKTLQQVGDEYGLTRERVRQICDAVIQVLQSRPIAMPALDKLMAAAARIAPVHVDEADLELANLLGPGVGLGAALEFAELTGRQTVARSAFAKTRTPDGYAAVRVLHSDASQLQWFQKAISFAHRECKAVGCTNLLRVAGHLSLTERVSADPEELLALFKGLPGFRLLEEEWSWFTLPGGLESELATRLKKLLCVSTQSVGIDDLLAAIVTDDRLFFEMGRTLSLPPFHILVELLSGWPWLHADGHNKYRAREPIARQDVLSALELQALEVMEAHHDVATRTDLAKAVVGEGGVSNMALSAALSTSPIFAKVEHAVYRVNGRPLQVQGLVEARKRRLIETRTAVLPEDLDASMPLSVTLRQSGSLPPVRRVVYLPSAFGGLLSGTFEHARRLWPAIAIGSNLQISKLADVAADQGIGPKQSFNVVFDVESRTYELAIP